MAKHGDREQSCKQYSAFAKRSIEKFGRRQCVSQRFADPAQATDVFFYDNTFRIDNRHAVRKFMHCIPERAKSRIRKIEMIPGDTTPSQAGRSYTMAKLRERGIIDSFVRHIRPLANLTCCTITWPDSDNWFWDKNFVVSSHCDPESCGF